MVRLNTFDFLNGLFSVIIVIVGLIVSFLIISKYFRSNNKSHLYMGISWIGMYQSWWPSSISFISVLIYGKELSLSLYIIIGNIFIPFFIVILILAITEMTAKKYQKSLVLIYIIIELLVDIYILYYVIVDPTVIGELETIFDIRYKSVVMINLIFIMLTIQILGLIFARHSIKIGEPETKFRGIMLILAFLSYMFGGLIDASLHLNEFTLIIIRIILILSSMFFYISFLSDKTVKKIVNK